MQATSMKDMFEKAFGLSVDTMKVNKAYNVSEARIGVQSLSQSGAKVLSRVLYAVKKPRVFRVSITVEGRSVPLVTSRAHRIGYREGPEAALRWVQASALVSLLKRQPVYVETVEGLSRVVTAELLPKDYLLDIQVEGARNYYSNGILSHNCMYGPDFTTTGGRAIKYYASWRGRITRIDDILEKGSLVGIVSKVRATKNKIGINKREAELRLKFASGFDSEEEYLKFIIDLGIVTQRGAWFYQEEWGFKGSGRASLVEFLRSRPELFEMVKNTVNAKLCAETDIDRANALKAVEEEPDLEEDTPPEDEE